MSDDDICPGEAEQEQPIPLAAEALPVAQIVPEEMPALVKPPHPGFWWAVLWCIAFFVVTQVFPALVEIVIMMFLVMRSPERFKLDDPLAILSSDEFATPMMIVLLLDQILSIVMSWLVIRLIVGKEWPRILALRRPSLAHLIFAVIGLPGLILVGMGIDALAKQVLPSFIALENVMAMFGKWPWPIGVLLIGVGPGIGEELWCRGFLGRGLVGRYGFRVGVLLTSLFFGVLHGEPRQIVATFFMGILLHFSYLASRSILVPMLLHMGNNSLSILSMHIPFLKGIDVPPEQVPLQVYGAGILLVAAVAWAFFRSRARLVDFPSEAVTAALGGAFFPSGTYLAPINTAAVASSWRPAFPGVEYPPAATETSVHHSTPDWKTCILVAGGLLVFAGSIFGSG